MARKWPESPPNGHTLSPSCQQLVDSCGQRDTSWVAYVFFHRLTACCCQWAPADSEAHIRGWGPPPRFFLTPAAAGIVYVCSVPVPGPLGLLGLRGLSF